MKRIFKSEDKKNGIEDYLGQEIQTDKYFDWSRFEENKTKQGYHLIIKQNFDYLNSIYIYIFRFEVSR